MTERQIQETIARCVSTMVYYHNCERSRPSFEQMRAEVQLVAGWICETGWDADETNRLVFRPVEAELLARYGHEVAPRLFVEFFEAFEQLSMVDIQAA